MDPQPDMAKICRACLTEGAPMRSIYSVEEALGDEATTLFNILSSCSPLKVLQGDGLPENVCLNCCAEMTRAYLFWKLCQKSDATLRQFLESFRGLQVKQEEEDEFACELDASEGHGESPITEEKPNLEHLIAFKEERREIEAPVAPVTLITRSVRHRKPKAQNSVIRRSDLPRTCHICNKIFRYPNNLQRHLLTHTGVKPHLCNVCGKGFAQLSYLRIHMHIHTGEKPYKCHLCDKRFSQPGTLTGHIRSHTGERPFACKICGKGFMQSSYLSLHNRIHFGEKRYQCKVCPKKFLHSSHLHVHMRMHSGEKPHSCTECGRSFGTKNMLTRHIRTHTGERPYACMTCGQAFAQSSTLNTHKKIHRPK